MSSVTDPEVRATVPELANARVRAGRVRAQWLLKLESGQVSPGALLAAAHAPGGRPLMALRLKQVLFHMPGLGTDRALAVLRELRVRCCVPEDRLDAELNVAWLVKGQPATRASRLNALAEAIVRQRDGFDACTVGAFPYRPLGVKSG